MRDIESKFQELAMDPRRGDVSPEAGAPILDEVRRRCVSDGDLYRLIGNDASTAVCKVLQGDIGDGIRFLEEAISKQEKRYLFLADYYRLLLCEVYLQIISRNEKPPLASLLKNLPILLKVIFAASARLRAFNEERPGEPGARSIGSTCRQCPQGAGLTFQSQEEARARV